MVVKEIPYFDLSEICDSGQCFRMERITENEFQIRAEDKYLRATQEGETVRFDCSEEEFETFWKHYFDLERDYGIYIEAIDPEDTYLKTAAELGSGIRILNQDLWEMIVSFLISQQNNIFRIRKCIDRISRRYGRGKKSRGRDRLSCFSDSGGLKSGHGRGASGLQPWVPGKICPGHGPSGSIR